MKRLLIVLPFLLLIHCGEPPFCKGDRQENCIPETEYFIGKFHWAFTLPGDYEQSSAFHKYYVEAQNHKQRKVLAKQGIDIKGNHKTLINLFGDGNFYASYQKYDHSIYGEHTPYFEQTCDGLKTYVAFQHKNAQVTASTATQEVDGFTFLKCKVQAQFSPTQVSHWFIYSRLFGKSELSITIDFEDAFSGNLLLNAFLNSSFGNKKASMTN